VVGFSFLEMDFDDKMSADGEAANAQVCKTCIRGFNSRSALQRI
jgi:hypothetical protein